jgi:4-amino-4-deoxy-L-arabinose transferase-like glycosyltransferase
MAGLTAGWPMPRLGGIGAGRQAADLRRRDRAAGALSARDVALLSVAALIVRVGWVFHTPGYRPVRDGVDFNRLAAALALGHGYVLHGMETAFRPPGYPGFLALWYTLTGVPTNDWSGVRLLQAGLGGVTVVLIAAIASELWGRRAGLLAGTIACVYPPLWLVSEAMVSEALFVPLVLVAVTTALIHRRRGGYPWLVACGLAIGLATLTRPVGLLMLLPLALLCQRTVRWRAPAVLALTVAAVLTPWTVRNYSVFHTFVPISTESGETLAGTYNALSRSDPAQPAAWRIPHRVLPWQPRRVPGYDRLEARLAHASEPARDTALRNAALSFIGAHPGYLLTVWFWNTRRLLDLGGLARARETAATIGLGPGAALTAVIAFWLLAPLALLGAFSRAARRTPRALWAVPLLGYLSIVFVTTETPRFRAAIEPFLILLACAALCDLAPRLRRLGARLAAAR